MVDSYLHVSAVLQSLVLATLVAVVLGVLVYRSPLGSAAATAATSAILTVPSFALLGLLIPVLGLGVAPTIVALVVYALLPILRNTIIGLSSVDPSIVAAPPGGGRKPQRGLGPREVPLAWAAVITRKRGGTQVMIGMQ
ncbi:ABC transporter permease, partial [Nocardia farcinica]|uniref:ABC transporter permease n=1 Tax=Nocardia farcinica TaxID=37329 RepID=UPI002456A4B2